MLLVNHAEPADGYVRTDAWLAGIAVKTFTGIRFKVPCLP